MNKHDFIARAEQAAFLESFLGMLKECDAIAADTNDMVLRHWVTQWYGQWGKLTNEHLSPSWAAPPLSGPVKAARAIRRDLVSRDQQENALHSFWMLLASVASYADDARSETLKSRVEGWYRQWNGFADDDKSPAWIMRAKMAGLSG